VSEVNLSVVVLVYNTEKYLRQCFDSLIAQTLPNIEIIAVDDESTDNSLSICKEYEKRYDHFRVITQKNQGGAVAGTTGMKHAKGKYIALVDSDDFLPVDAYEILFNQAEKYEAQISIGRPLRYLNGEFTEVILPEERAVWEEERCINSVFEIKTLFHDKFYWNKIFRRDFIERHQIYMPAGYLYADFLMLHKAYAYAQKIAITDKVTYFWRRDELGRIAKSASQGIASCENFKERTRSLLFEVSNDAKILEKTEDLKLLLLSFVFHDIIENINFRKTFLIESKKVLDKIDDIHKHDIHPLTKLQLWLIKNHHIEELFYLLGKRPRLVPTVRNGKAYCVLPFFENETLRIPDEIYEYKRLRPELIKNFLYTEKGSVLRFQIFLHAVSHIDKRDFFLFFKDETGKTHLKCKLEKNGNYFSCEIDKKRLLRFKRKLFIAVGDSDNISYYITKAMSEPAFKALKGIYFIMDFTKITKRVYIKKRNMHESVQRIYDFFRKESKR
jgi:glycosyltransferase involved in cell wall biosynthesis